MLMLVGEVRGYQTRVDREKPRNLDFGLWTLDFFYGLRMTQGCQLDHSLSQRLLQVVGWWPIRF